MAEWKSHGVPSVDELHASEECGEKSWSFSGVICVNVSHMVQAPLEAK